MNPSEWQVPERLQALKSVVKVARQLLLYIKNSGTNEPQNRDTKEKILLLPLRKICYTGRFIMFSVITNIYNKKTKGPTLMELFTITGKLIFFLTTIDVRCVHHGLHSTHRYDIQVVATHASACVATT